MVDLLMVGGGHAHVHVLEALSRYTVASHRVLMLTAESMSTYSGMVPGLVAGRYGAADVQVPVAELARRAGVDVRVSRVVAVDADGHVVRLEDGTAVPFRFLSLNVGATVSGMDLPGVREYAIPTRPIGAFVNRLRYRLEEPGRRPERVVVVGGGAGGVELAFAVHERLGGRVGVPRVSLVHGGEEILEGAPPDLVRRVRRRAREVGVPILCGRRAVAVDATSVVLHDGERVSADLVIWATGAEGHDFLRDSGLACDPRGFVKLRQTLQGLYHDDILAAGDCALPERYPRLPRSGVHAVRQGPVLAANLVALLRGDPLREYHPQRDTLALLDVGGGTAVGSKWGQTFEGWAVMHWKEWIDRRFVRRFTPTSVG